MKKKTRVHFVLFHRDSPFKPKIVVPKTKRQPKHKKDLYDLRG